MKKASLILAMGACLSSIAQSSDGTLLFKTLGIQKADGSGVYNVPLYQSPDLEGGPLVGAGLLSGGVTLGLFNLGSTTPFATSILGTTTTTAPFAVTPASQTVSVPGAGPGSSPSITVRAWQGPSYGNAIASGLAFGEWTFTTKPLGGDPGGGVLPILPPTLTGFGPENGEGIIIAWLIPEPSIFALAVVGVGAWFIFPKRQPSR